MSPPLRFGRTWRSWGWVALALAVLYALALLASGWSVSRARAALRRHGRPMVAEDLIPAPVPDVDNGALLYNVAIQILKATPWQPDPAQPATPLIEAAAAAAEEWVNGDVWAGQEAALAAPFRQPALTMAIALVEQGNARPACRYDVHWGPDPPVIRADTERLRDLGRILAGKAVVAARDGHGQEAWQTILTGLRLARAVQQGPRLVSNYFLTEQTDALLKALAQVQGQALPDAATSQALAGALEALAQPRAMAARVDDLRLSYGRIFTWRGRRSFPPYGPYTGIRWVGLWLYASPLALPLWQLDHACYLRAMDAAAATMLKPYDPTDVRLDDELRRSIPRCCLLAPWVAAQGMMGEERVRGLELLARVRLARVGLGLLAARSPDGAFPKDLSGLTAAGIDCTDPFTGKPLVYRPTESGFVLYSLGRDQRDDHGTPWSTRAARQSHEASQGWDVVWPFPPAGPG